MTIETYATIPARLRAIASTLVGEPRKKLLAISLELEQSADLLKPSHARRLKRAIAKKVREKQPPLPSGGASDGLEATNCDRSNDERIQDTIADVTAAVAKLKTSHDWDSLGARERIKLIQTETLPSRKAKISSQTLYRPWARPLW